VTIDFKGIHYPKDVILHAVFFYVRYAVSYRDLEEIMAERVVAVGHATLNRWMIKYAPLIAKEAHKRKKKTAVSWRMDETYIRVKGKWTYYYRAVDKFEKPLISCCQNAGMRQPQPLFSRVRSGTTDFPAGL
jgi:putative transposase